MKDLVINLAAPWVGTFKSWVDGDIFRESNIDTQLGSIGNRLGYLYTQVWGRALLTGDNEFAGNQVWTSGSAIFGVPVEFTQPIDATGQPLIVGDVAAESITLPNGQGGIKHRVTALADADVTIASVNHDSYRIPALSAARIYTLPNNAIYNGRRVRFTRVGSEAFAVRIREASAGPGVYVGTFGSGTKGWIEFICDAAVWKADAWIQDASVVSNVV